MLSLAEIQSAIPDTLLGVDVPGLGARVQGKVRDIYVDGGQRILITTDRVLSLRPRVGRHPLQGPGAEPVERLVVRPDTRHRG